MPTPQEELIKSRENFVKLGSAATYSFAMHAALLKASHELLPTSKHAELAVLSKKYLPEALEREEIRLEDMDPRIAAVISELLDRKD